MNQNPCQNENIMKKPKGIFIIKKIYEKVDSYICFVVNTLIKTNSSQNLELYLTNLETFFSCGNIAIPFSMGGGLTLRKIARIWVCNCAYFIFNWVKLYGLLPGE